jgi:hypothetical protein
MNNSFWQYIGAHALPFLTGSTVFGIISHAVNTFPQPTNPYGKWLLGTIQWIVGQREQGLKTMSELSGANPDLTPKEPKS